MNKVIWATLKQKQREKQLYFYCISFCYTSMSFALRVTYSLLLGHGWLGCSKLTHWLLGVRPETHKGCKVSRAFTASEHSVRTDWLNVSVLSTIFGNPALLLFQIWYLANWIFRSLFPSTQGAVTRFNPYGFLVRLNSFYSVWSQTINFYSSAGARGVNGLQGIKSNYFGTCQQNLQSIKKFELKGAPYLKGLGHAILGNFV